MADPAYRYWEGPGVFLDLIIISEWILTFLAFGMLDFFLSSDAHLSIFEYFWGFGVLRALEIICYM